MLHRLRQTRSSPRGTAPQTWWSRDCAHRPVSTPHNPPVCLSHWSPRPASQPIKIPTSYPLDRQIKSGESSGLLTCWLLEHVTGQDLATIRVHGLSHWWPPQIVRTSYPRHASPSTHPRPPGSTLCVHTHHAEVLFLKTALWIFEILMLSFSRTNGFGLFCCWWDAWVSKYSSNWAALCQTQGHLALPFASHQTRLQCWRCDVASSSAEFSGIVATVMNEITIIVLVTLMIMELLLGVWPRVKRN